MKKILLAAVAAVSYSLFGAVEYRWTGAKDSSWKDAANWTDKDGAAVMTYPGEGAADRAMFIISAADQVIDVDIGDGVTVDSIFITTSDNTYFDNGGTETPYSQLIPLGAGTVNFSGTGALTLTHPGVGRTPNNAADIPVVGTLFASQKAVFNVPVNFLPSDGYCASTDFFYADFKEDVRFEGMQIWIKSGWLYPTYAIAVSGHSWQKSQTGEIHFRKSFTHARSQQYAAVAVGDSGDPSGNVFFHGKVTAPGNFGGGSISAASSSFILCSSENQIGKIINGWVAATAALGANVFGGAVLSDTFSVTSAQAFRSGINLMGFDQTADRVDGINDSRNYDSLPQNYAIRSIVNKTGSVTNYTGNGAMTNPNFPATLTLNGTNNATTDMVVVDAVSLVWNPSGDFTQTFQKRRHVTTGTITVQNGTFKIAGATTWENVPELTIAGTAKFDASTVTGDANPMANLKRVLIAAGGKIVTGADAPSIETAVLRYAGEYVANGTYAAQEGDGVIAVPWVEGDGTVIVNGLKDKSIAVWALKGDGDFEDGSNWSCGEVPGTSGTVKDVILDGGSGKTVTLKSAFSTPGFNLTIGAGYTFKVAEGASFTFAQDASDATRYQVTVLAGGTWTNAGTVAFSNYRGECSVRAGGVLTTSGSFTYSPRDTHADKFLVEGAFIATAGDVAFPGPSLKVVDGAVFDIGDAAFTFDGTISNELLFDGGTVTFAGEARIGKITYGTALTFKPAGNNILTVNFKDHAGFLTASDGRDIRFMGGMAGGKTVLNYEAKPDYTVKQGDENYKTVEWLIGCGAGEVEATVAACCTQTTHAAGLKIGTPLSAADTTVPVTANMTIFGTSISGGTLEAAWGADNAPIGVIVGYGLGIGAETTVSEGRPYQGAVSVDGGLLRANNGTCVIGAGYGKGTVAVVNKGQFDAPLGTYNNTYARKDGLHDNDGYPPCVIGMNGGEGLVTVSGAGSLYRALQGKTYIGGIARDQVPIFVRDYTVSPARLYYRSWNPVGWVESLKGTAKGALVVDGGKLQIDRGLELGADGTGILEVVGNGSTVTVKGDLILKDATDEDGTTKAGAAILRWTAQEDGLLSPITLADNAALANKLCFTSGAKVEIDLAAAAKKRSLYKLISTTRALSADSVALENVPFEVKNVPGEATVTYAKLEQREDGIYACVRYGGTLIIVK